jgi:hypothetical protein
MLFGLFTPSWWKTRKKWMEIPTNRSYSRSHPSRWVCWILDPQPLSFRSQKTILTIPATAKCDSFPEVFSPPSPRFFLLICIRASALPCAPFPPCVTLRDKAGNLLWCIEFNTPPSILCKLFYLLPHCCCLAPTVCLLSW